MIWGVTNVTRIQKALWLCRGLWGRFPTCCNLSWLQVRTEGFWVMRPFVPTEQMNNQQNKPPLIPIFPMLCSNTRPGGNTSLGRIEILGGGKKGSARAKKKIQRCMKRISLWGGRAGDVTWCVQKFVPMFTFSQICMFLFPHSVLQYHSVAVSPLK